MAKKKKKKLEDPDLIEVKTKPDYDQMAYEQRQNECQHEEDQIGIAWANFQALGDADQEAKWQLFEKEKVNGNMYLVKLSRDDRSMIYSFKNWLVKNL